MTRRFCNFAFLVSLLLGHGLMAKVIYVDDNASEGGSGTSWSTAHKYLQDALAIAEDGDEIWVAEGIYKPDQGVGFWLENRNYAFELKNNVNLFGGFIGIEDEMFPLGDSNKTILSGEISSLQNTYTNNVLLAEGIISNTKVSGFQITNGYASGILYDNRRNAGGGFYIVDSNLTVTNCTFINNYSGNGGDIKVDGGYTEFVDCNFTGHELLSSQVGGAISFSGSGTHYLKNIIFEYNKATDNGGAIYISGTGLYKVENASFIGNEAENGGALYLSENLNGSSEVKLIKSTFIENSAEIKGGGVYAESNTILLRENNFLKNFSRDGAAIYSKSLTTITESNFTNNEASLDGGAIYSSGSSIIDSSIFEKNKAKYGGAIRSSGSTKVFNTVFENNVATSMGGAIRGSFVSQNSIFYLNEAGQGGGVFLWQGEEAIVTNCVFVKNLAYELNGGSFIKQYFYSSYSGGYNLFLSNSIVYENFVQLNKEQGFVGDNWNSYLLDQGIEERFPDDPLAVAPTYASNNNIIQGWDGDSRAFDADPLFVNIEDPKGVDETWFTNDDGLRLKADSIGVNAGFTNAITLDTGDLDKDENLTEYTPFDVLRRTRTIGSNVDIGPYEFNPDNPPPLITKALTLNANFGGNVNGGGDFEEGSTVLIQALPFAGYLFSEWSGDRNGSTNPLSVTLNSSMSLTANFIQDSNDDDGDSLTNFDELVNYGTDPSKQDSDNDGILDAKEVEIGSDPNTSDAVVFNFGKASVTNDPASYSLVTKSAYDQALLDANETAEQAIIDAKVSAKAEGITIGKSEGEQSVLGNPSAYNLFTSEQYEQALQSLDTNATPYTSDWFYTPEQGWMWSQKGVYPWFYDANSSNWMYFKSGHDNPRFYNHGTKEWMTLE